VVVREYEVLGCQRGGSGKATVKVRYKRLASVAVAALDDAWWQHASSAQKKTADTMKRTLESLATLP
jgi:hypothetical protein